MVSIWLTRVNGARRRVGTVNGASRETVGDSENSNDLTSTGCHRPRKRAIQHAREAVMGAKQRFRPWRLRLLDCPLARIMTEQGGQ